MLLPFYLYVRDLESDIGPLHVSLHGFTVPMEARKLSKFDNDELMTKTCTRWCHLFLVFYLSQRQDFAGRRMHRSIRLISNALSNRNDILFP